ncbi:MAG: cyclopropane-fatty-acyl-phospholipid synthase [Woeseiaceae bacterium]|nr:cyclopropane-fatty-acyl-phospholipid synthase [Woeseiaceae bacterium]
MNKSATPKSLSKYSFNTFSRRAVLSRFEKLQEGQITVTEGEKTMVFGNLTEDFPKSIYINVVNAKFYSCIAFGGAIGASEAYMQQYWTCDELVDVLRILIRNRDVLEKVDSGLALLKLPMRKLLHALNKNTRRGSRKNIAAHYDLSNEFYQLWLDQKMMYSCAFFDPPDASLETAATQKLDRICKKLDLKIGDSVIEIGAGWGGFAIYAATNYGCHVTTTTISQQQFDYAQRAIKEAGLEDRITILHQDYRDLSGNFDKLVSIEMIEAVGHSFHASYFKKCCELLKPDGQMLLQAITIADQRYKQYKNSVDFINKYIFPGGCLTSVTSMTETITRYTDMRVFHLEDMAPHYAKTLNHWHNSFFAHIEDIRKLGFSDSFIHLWDYYLCYCESAFTERATGVVQMLIMRPNLRREKISY